MKSKKSKVDPGKLLINVKQSEKKYGYLFDLCEMFGSYVDCLASQADTVTLKEDLVTSDQLDQLQETLMLLQDIRDRHYKAGRESATKYLKAC